MTTVSIIGGGRWARTIAGVISSLPSAPERTILHSRHNAAAVETWIAERRLQGRVGYAPDWPDYGRHKPDAVIVANRAADHFAAVTQALSAGIPVLVEKPMAIGQGRIRQLRDLAAVNHGVLAASHVFLFARYLEAFVNLIAAHGDVRHIDLVWQDGQDDIIRGETKSYDPSVSVFDDVLPHIVPMLGRLHPGHLSLVSLDIENGGAQVVIEAEADGTVMFMRLARNMGARRRVLSAQTERGTCTLDFSDEPGVLDAPGVIGRNGDPLWDRAPRPLAAMLTAFLDRVGGGAFDSRLSPEKALASAALADAVRERYVPHQIRWLEQHIGKFPDASLAYAMQEFGIGENWNLITDASMLHAALVESPPLGVK